MVETGLGFGVLGPLEMTANGALLTVGTPKQRAVLAMLVMNRNRPVALESLIAAAWGDRPPAEAKTSLHSYVSNLRRLLGGVGVESRAVLASAAPGYRLTVSDAACDLGRFIVEKTAGVRAAAAGELEKASDHLSAALAEWRGPALEDLRDFGFVEAFATALAEDKMVAHTVRAEAEIACGRAYSVISELETLVADQPYREPLWQQLMTAYYCSGRQSDALDAYRRLETTLTDDLGIDPGPSVRDLHARILRQEQLDVKKSAQANTQTIITTHEQRARIGGQSSAAHLRDESGQRYPLKWATAIGRLADNDIVLDDRAVSRRHAVIVDTGTSYVIKDLRSANGVEVQNQRIDDSATLADGDVLLISGHRFTFEITCG
jgi:DNA-binding SARP family transcriptional activator